MACVEKQLESINFIALEAGDYDLELSVIFENLPVVPEAAEEIPADADLARAWTSDKQIVHSVLTPIVERCYWQNEQIGNSRGLEHLR